MADRREKVTLELDDGGFSTQMVKNAAATGLLERALKSLDGTTVRINENIDSSSSSIDNFARSARDADGSINQLTGRLRVLGEVGAIIAPTLSPIGGVAVAGVGGLANQLGLAAVAGGVLVASMQGVGDALEAMNKAQLEPTDKNLEKARDALRALSPAAREFAREAFALKPALVALRDIGAEALFPGLTSALESLERLGPRVGGIMEAVAGALGDIASDGAASLATERWEGFFDFIRAEAPGTLRELASTVGDLAHGLAELWEAFQPLNSDFSSWLMDVADGFDSWATGLSATEGFQNFLDYVRETGPQVADTLGAMFNAVVQLVQASAPLGGPVLDGLEAAADVIGAIADSDLGTPIMAGVTALALLNRTLAVTASLSKVSLNSGLFAGVGQLTSSVRGGANSPLLQLQALPGAMRAATSAQDDLAASQKRASGITSAYVGQLQAVNSTTSRGFKPSMQTLDRLTDSLDQVELANRDVATATQLSIDAEGKRRETLKRSGIEVGKAAALMGGLAIASSGAADSIGLTNTTSLALMGTLVPGGVVIGAVAGAFLDMKAAQAQAQAQLVAFEAQIKTLSLDEMNMELDRAQGLLAALGGESSEGDMAYDLIKSRSDALEEQIAATKKLEAQQRLQDRTAAMSYASQVGLNTNLAIWQRKSTEQIKAQADALKAVDEQAQATADSFGLFGETLNDKKKSLAQFITEMQSTADAMINFNDNSRRAAKRGLDDGLVASLRNAGEEGALRMRQLANASESEIGRANKAFRNHEKAVQDTIDTTRRLAGLSPLTVKLKAETSGAMNDIEGLERRLRAIKDEDVFVNVRQINSGDTQLGPRVRSARGNFLTFYAEGGMENHVAQIAPAGAMRIWAEPETGGESYIPHANDHRRPRAKGILEQTASLFGGSVEWFAEGGMKDGKRKPKSGAAFFASDNTSALQAAIDRLTDVASTQTAALEEATSAQEFWAGKMSDLAQATVSGFNTGLFERDSNVWSAGSGGGPLANLMKDISGLNERQGLQVQLAGMGLTGDTLAALLSQGSNSDISALIASGQVSQYADLYAQRAALQGSVGGYAGQAAYGMEYSAAVADVRAQTVAVQESNVRIAGMESRMAQMQMAINRMTDEAPERTGAEVGRVINDGAATAQRAKNSGVRRG